MPRSPPPSRPRRQRCVLYRTRPRPPSRSPIPLDRRGSRQHLPQARLPATVTPRLPDDDGRKVHVAALLQGHMVPCPHSPVVVVEGDQGHRHRKRREESRGARGVPEILVIRKCRGLIWPRWIVWVEEHPRVCCAVALGWAPLVLAEGVHRWPETANSRTSGRLRCHGECQVRAGLRRPRCGADSCRRGRRSQEPRRRRQTRKGQRRPDRADRFRNAHPALARFSRPRRHPAGRR